MRLARLVRLSVWTAVFGGGAWVGWQIQDLIQPPATFGLPEEAVIVGGCGLFAVLVVYGLVQVALSP